MAGISTPVLGMSFGILAGFVVGLYGIRHFEIEGLFNAVCFTGSTILMFQLLGSTIASALGKPHQPDNTQNRIDDKIERETT